MASDSTLASLGNPGDNPTEVTSYSLAKSPPRELVGSFAQQRLLIWLPPTQRVEMNPLIIQIHLAADEPMSPLPIHFKAASEQISPPTFIGTSQKDKSPTRVSLQIQPEAFRKGSPRWSRFQPGRDSLPIRPDILNGLALECSQRLVLESRPDFDLPSTIEALNRGLKSSLAWRRKHGHYIQTQAQPHNRTDHVPVLMRSLENGVVVKLCKLRQPHLPPMSYQRFPSQASVHAFSRARFNQAAVQRYGCQDFYPDTTANHQAFDDIELVKLPALAGNNRKVPTCRRRRPATTTAFVEYTVPLKDSVDCAWRGRSGFKLGQQLTVNSLRAKFPKRALVAQLPPQIEDSIFPPPIGSIVHRFGNGGPIGPIDTVKPLIFGPTDPALDRSQTDTEPASNRTQRSTTTHCCHQMVTLRLLAMFLFIVTSRLSVSDYDTDAKALTPN